MSALVNCGGMAAMVAWQHWLLCFVNRPCLVVHSQEQHKECPFAQMISHTSLVPAASADVLCICVKRFCNPWQWYHMGHA